MPATRRWITAAVVVLAGLLAACDTHPTGRAAERHGTLALDLSALNGRATVLQQAVLTVEGENGFRAELVQPIERTEMVKTFEVSVPVGSVRFTAELLSNQQSGRYALLSGSTTLDVREDGFQVEVPLNPNHPVLVVTPDSLELRFVEDYVFLTVANRGLGRMRWNASIGNEGCLFMQPTSGSLSEGDSVEMFVSRVRTDCSGRRGVSIDFESHDGDEMVGGLALPVVLP